MTNLTQVTEVTLPDSLITIGDYAFSGATNLRRINIPDSVATIGVNSFIEQIV